MTHLPYAVIELAMVALFAGALWDAARTGRRAILELISAVPFGLLLEQGDILIFGSYAYNQAFFLRLGAVPVAIALAWAMIIRSCMAISDAAGISAWRAPCSDALLAIILDLSFDTIAIRQGLWHWNLRLDQGFFGVPAGNYFAWLFVALGFSAWTRVVRRWSRRQRALVWLQLVVPVPAYLTLLFALVPFIALRGIFSPGPGGGFPFFFAALTVLAFVGGAPLLRSRSRVMPSPLVLLPRLAMHAYAFAAGTLLGVFVRLPVLLAVSLAMLGVEGWLTGVGRRRSRHDSVEVVVGRGKSVVEGDPAGQ